MRIATVIEHNGEPALGIPYTNTDGVIFRVRIKALNTGILLEGFHQTVPCGGPGIITLPHILKKDEQVAYDAYPVNMADVEDWYASDECVSLLDYLSTGGDAPRDGPFELAEKVAEKVGEILGQDQDHEPDNGPDVGQDEPETDQSDVTCVETRELTDLQRAIMRYLNIVDCLVADIAEMMGKTTNSDKVQIRKAVHELRDMGLVIKKDTEIQNGRPAQIWGVA
ncbi:MAG: hypothetical protein ACI381_05795 [Candidatus Methanomethylophilaceae archaeon]